MHACTCLQQRECKANTPKKNHHSLGIWLTNNCSQRDPHKPRQGLPKSERGTRGSLVHVYNNLPVTRRTDGRARAAPGDAHHFAESLSLPLPRGTNAHDAHATAPGGPRGRAVAGAR